MRHDGVLITWFIPTNAFLQLYLYLRYHWQAQTQIALMGDAETQAKYEDHQLTNEKHVWIFFFLQFESEVKT